MGKKYIIELESGTHIFVLGPEGIVHIGEPDVVYETVDGMQIGDAVINAKPYTEPNLEQVRKEAYQRGYCDALEKHCEICDEKHDAYQQGLNDAWEAARKILKANWEERHEMFGAVMILENIFLDNTASEAIEKIRQYEQKKEEIQLWDEVINGRNFKGTVTSIKDDGMLTIFCQDGTWINSHTRSWKKTGRHFPEIATVLEKMRGE